MSTGGQRMTIGGINTSMSSILVTEMAKTSKEILHIFGDLADGRKISKPSDDPVGISLISRLESQVRGLAMAESNAQMGISMTQTADSYLATVTDDVQRIQELAVQAANGTLTDTDRQAIQNEIDQLTENVQSTLDNAQFNSKSLFDGSAGTFNISTGGAGNQSVDLPEISGESLGLGNIDVTTQAGAENSITMAAGALDNVLHARTELGAQQNGLESTMDTLSQSRQNALESLSRINDVNIAEEMIKATRAMMALKTQAKLLSQVKDLDGGLVMQLLGKDNG